MLHYWGSLGLDWIPSSSDEVGHSFKGLEQSILKCPLVLVTGKGMVVMEGLSGSGFGSVG